MAALSKKGRGTRKAQTASRRQCSEFEEMKKVSLGTRESQNGHERKRQRQRSLTQPARDC